MSMLKPNGTGRNGDDVSTTVIVTSAEADDDGNGHGGHVNVACVENSSRDDDDDDDDDDGVFDGFERTEPTPDDLEDLSDMEMQQNQVKADQAKARRRRSVVQPIDVSDTAPPCCDCDKCCGGCRACWRRAAVEARIVRDDIRWCAAEARRQYPCDRSWWIRWAHKQFPMVDWLPRYTLRHLRGDIVAGLTTGLSVIPQGLAYGQIVEVAPQYGLYSAFMGSFVYAIFGTAKDIAIGPSVVVSILAATYGTGNAPIPKDPTYAILLALFSGILQAAMGLLRLGFLFEFVSLPVMKAYRAAAGITIFMSRIKKWWGLQGVPRDFLPQLYWTLKRLPETNLYDLLLGGLCILMLFTFKKLKAYRWHRRFRDLPWYLKIINRIFWILGAERNILVVIFASAVVYAMMQNDIPISHTDIIPPGVPEWRVPNFTITVPETNVTVPFHEMAFNMGPGIFFIAFIGIMETISVGTAFGKKGNYKIDYNQELLAVGISNILCSFVSGHPVTGAFLRSAINFNSGVKTPAAGMLAAAVVLICLTVATPLMTYIPVCAMAATIMMGGIDVVTFHKFGILWKTKRSDLVPYLVTFIVSLTWGIQYGVFIGVGVDLLMMLYSTMTPVVKIIPATNDPTVKVVHIQPKCGLLFPAVQRMTTKINNGDYAGVETIVIDLSAVADTDSTVVQALRYLNRRNKTKSIRMLLYDPQPAVEAILNRTSLRQLIVKSLPAAPEADHSSQERDGGRLYVIPSQEETVEQGSSANNLEVTHINHHHVNGAYVVAEINASDRSQY